MTVTIAEAAATNDRRATLVAMRDKLAADMDVAPAVVVAQIAGRLAAILTELDSIKEPGKVSSLDELEKRRAGRLATADEPAPARKQTRERGKRSG